MAEIAAKPERLDRERVLAWLQEYGVYAAVLALLAFNILFTPNFLDVGNFRTQLVQVTPIVIVSLGMALVIGTEGIDLSVGSVMALAAAVVVLYLGYGALPAIAMALLAGMIDMATAGSGMLAPLRTATYVIMDGDDVGGMRRVIGFNTEASAYGALVLSFGAIIYFTRIGEALGGVYAKIQTPMALALIAFTVLSTSSAAFLGLVVQITLAALQPADIYVVLLLAAGIYLALVPLYVWKALTCFNRHWDPFRWSRGPSSPLIKGLHFALLLGIAIALPVALAIRNTSLGAALAVNIGNIGRAVPSLAILAL